MTKLTVTALRALRAKDKPFRVRDAERTGLCVIVERSGARIFAIAAWKDGRDSYFRLGPWNDTEQAQPPAVADDDETRAAYTLAQAREIARRWKDRRTQGRDPVAERAQRAADREAARVAAEAAAMAAAAAAERERNIGTVADLFASYVQAMRAKGRRSADRVEYELNRYALPHLGASRRARDVTRDDVASVIRRVSERGSKTQANRMHAYMSAAFAHGVAADVNPHIPTAPRRFDLASNPAAGIPKADEKPGEHVLTADELRAVWKAAKAGELAEPFAGALRFLIAMAGPRVRESTGALWAEINEAERTWTLPSERSKNGRPTLRPLTDSALEVIKGLPSRDLLPALFPAPRKAGATLTENSLSQAVLRWQRKATADALELRADPPFRRFEVRDLRRTCKTLLADLGISKEVRDALHNHAATDVAERNYNRSHLLVEKRAALGLWADFLESELAPEAFRAARANVTDIAQARARREQAA
jgi:integrase